MGQLLIVQASGGPETESLFRRGLALFESLHHIQPVAQQTTAAGAVAVLPSLHGPRTGIVEDGSGGWICGAGTWFFEGAAGEEGLRRMLRHPRRDHSAAAWLKEIDGAFAIALSGPEPGALRVVTDLLGTLHIYSASTGSAAVICTSSLVLAALLRPAWDPIGCRQFLATGTVFESRTLFEGIAKLAPASVYTFAGGQVKAPAVYWNLGDVMYDRAPRRGVPELAAALVRAVDTVHRNFKHPVMDLTGGFDSRAILGAALQAGAHFETVVNGAPGDGDVVSAQAIADAFQLTHHHRTRTPPTGEEWCERVHHAVRLCDGEYDAVLYAPVYATHLRLSGEFDASINGSNGEVAKGYWWELLMPHTGKPGRFDARMVAARRFVADGEEPGLLAHPFSEDLPDLFAGIIRRTNAGLENHPNTAQMDNVYLRMRMQRWQGRIASATSRIWPCVSPFSFREPMEAALAAPPAERGNNRMSRRLIEYQNPKLAALPLAQGYPALPWRLTTAHRFGALYAETARVVIRRAFLTLHLPSPFAAKQSAGPQGPGLWDHPPVRELLDPARMITRDLYNPEKLQGLLARSRAGSSTATARATRVLTLEMLARAVAGN